MASREIFSRLVWDYSTARPLPPWSLTLFKLPRLSLPVPAVQLQNLAPFIISSALFSSYRVADDPCSIKSDLYSIWMLSFQGHPIPLV